MSKQTNKKTSKFNSLLDAAKRTSQAAEYDSAVLSSKTDDKEVVSSPESNSTVNPVEVEENPVLTETPSTVKKGRPKGKRSNPDFEQVTAYIRSETYRETKIALLQLGESQDFSELVEKLLVEWLSTQKGKNSKT